MSNHSQAEEILKFKELLDKNIITQEEFEQKKKEILNGQSKNDDIQSNSKQTKTISANEFLSQQHQKQTKGCFGCLIFIFIIIGLSIIGSIIESQTPNNTKTNAEMSLIDKNIKEALNKIGIEQYEIKRDSDLDGNRGSDNTKAFRVTTDFSNGFIIVYTNTDDSVYSIRYVDKDYYLKGKVLANIKDDVITTDEALNYIEKTKLNVKNILKSPTTAKFPNSSDWKYTKKNKIIIIQGYVDSQNAFGAMIRSDFQLKYNGDMVTSFIFDGNELVKK